MSTRSSAFTLIELLVVIAIIGILSAVGTVAYNGYIGGTKKKAAENVLMQIGLAQTDHYASCGTYYSSTDGYCVPPTAEDECTPSRATTETIGNDLFGKPDYIKLQNGFLFCSFSPGTTSYTVRAVGLGDCQLDIDESGSIDDSSC